MNKWIRAFFKDTQRGCLVQAIAIAIGLPLGLGLVALPLFIISFLSGPSEDTVLLTVFLVMAPIMLIVMGGAFGAVFLVTRRRGNWLDELFAPLGLEASSYAMTGRQYHGRYQDRQLDIFFYRGPGLLFYVGAEAATRLAAAAQNEIVPQLARLFNGRPLEHNAPELEGIVVFAHEEAWGQKFVAQTAVQTALRRLIRGENAFLFRQVHIRPGAIYLKLWRTDRMLQMELTAAQIAEWTENLLLLAEMIEKTPPPAEILPVSAAEERIRSGKVTLIVAAVLAVILLPLFCIALILLPLLLYYL
jgi:hypothetical protein